MKRYKQTLYLAKTRSVLLNIVEGGGDVKAEVEFSHKRAPYRKWKGSGRRQVRQPFTDKTGEENKTEM